MAKQIPLVKGGQLHCATLPVPLDLEVGGGKTSFLWLDWLKSNRSFRFEYELTVEFQVSPTHTTQDSEVISFSAGKEKRPSGEFWYASKRIGGKVKKLYLGEDKHLSPAKLEETARRYYELALKSGRAPVVEPTKENGQTSHMEAHSEEIEALKARVAELEKDLFETARAYHAAKKELAIQSKLAKSWKEEARGKKEKFRHWVACEADKVKSDPGITDGDREIVAKAIDSLVKGISITCDASI